MGNGASKDEPPQATGDSAQHVSTDAHYEQLASTFTRLMDDQEETYQYQPLKKEDRQFRLLELLPLPEDSNTMVQCRMKYASTMRPDDLVYEAISYCWGDPTRSRTIGVDGKALRLPVNSEKALRRMTFVDRARVVYLDAVCINQDDLPERSSQVLLMSDIYRHGQATLVHLEDGDRSTAQAFADIRLLHLELRKEASVRGGMNVVLEQRSRWQDRYQMLINEQPLAKLFQRPWFRRVWVVQEIALAAKSILICGTEEVDMTIFLEVVQWLCLNQWSLVSEELQSGLSRVAHLYDACDTTALTGSQTLLVALCLYRTLETTDPRDRVYGMLGLLNQEQSDHKLLVPDYTMPVHEVYRDAVRCCVAQQPLASFGMYDLIPHREVSDLMTTGIPSWVPKFDRPPDDNLDNVEFTFHGTLEPLGDRKLANVPANASAEHPNILILLGKQICSIQAVSAVWRRDPELWLPGDLQDAMLSWYRDAATMSQRSGISEPALARTLVADTDRTSREQFEDPGTGLEELLQYDRDEVVVPPYTAFDDPDADMSMEPAAIFYFSMMTWCHNRKFAVMSNGTTGLVPSLTEPGDVVVMMHGATIPHVLRPCGEEFLMVGECYLNGWMSWQEHGDELHRRMLETEPTNFRIR